MMVVEYSADRVIKWIWKYSMVKFRKFVENLKTWTKILENLVRLWLWNKFRFDPVLVNWYTDEVADVLKSYETKSYIDEVDEWFLNAMWIKSSTIYYWSSELAINRWKLHKKYGDKIINNTWYSYENLSNITKININIVKKIKSINWWNTYLWYLVTKIERWIRLSDYDNAVLEMLNKMDPSDLHSIHYHHFLSKRRNRKSILRGNNRIFRIFRFKVNRFGNKRWNNRYMKMVYYECITGNRVSLRRKI